jgi:3-deoxy-manno-octulosonate cytidylyltransferase (CMP-KDO synthetase)
MKSRLAVHNWHNWKSARTLGIIPARMGSTRFPGKPLQPILGKPLVQYVYQNARLARSLDAVIVATDDERIVKAVEGFGGVAVMTSTSCASGTDRCNDVVRCCQAEFIVNIQGDEPLLCPEAIDQVGDELKLNLQCDMSTLRRIATDADLENHNVGKVVCNSQGYAIYFSRLPIPFIRDGERPDGVFHYKHIGIYGYKAQALNRLASAAPSDLERCEKLEQLRALDLGLKIKVVKTTFDSIGVDRIEDVAVVEDILRCRHGVD